MDILAKRLMKIAEEVAKPPKFDTVKGVPDWATSYILYDDASGLSAAERRMVDKYIKDMVKAGYVFVEPIEGTENEFNPYPKFGEACGTVDWTVEVVEPDPSYGENDDGGLAVSDWIDEVFDDYECRGNGVGDCNALRRYLKKYMAQEGYSEDAKLDDVPESVISYVERNGIQLWRDSLENQY